MQTAVQFLRRWETAVFSDFLKKPPPPPLASLGLPSAQEQKANPKTVESLRAMVSKRQIEREVFKKKKKKGGKRHKK